MSPSPAGGFFTTQPPGKPKHFFFFKVTSELRHKRPETPHELFFFFFFLVKSKESSNQDIPTPAYLLQSGPKDTVCTGSPAGSVVTDLPAGQETQEMGVRSLDGEDPLEEGMATHCSILAWRVPGTEAPGGLQSMGSQRLGQG